MTSVTEKSFSPTSFHFFTIVLQQTLQNNKLQIPKKIVRKCGSALADQVLLKLPCGSKWKLGLTKSSDGKVWIDKGWPEFSKQYSIARGHLLVFRYEGNSQFSVVIFDTTTTEIDYPFEKHVETERQKSDKFVKEEETKDDDDDDNSVEISDSPFSRPCLKTREGSPLPCSRPHKRNRNGPINGNTQSYRSTDLRAQGKLASGHKKGGVENSTNPLRLSAEEKARALERASGFKSKHPFFMLVMQPSHVQTTRCSLCLPRDFARLYLDASRQVILKGPDGGAWSVMYNFKGFDCKTSKPTFGSGWKAFAQDNDLKIGDVCAFVMTKSVGSVLFEVSFFRGNGTAHPSPVPGKLRKVKSEENNTANHGGRIGKASEAAEEFCSENPFFQVDFPSSHLDKISLTLPISFARCYLEKKTQIVNLQVGEKSWPVKLLYTHPAKYRFSRGWSVFLAENSLHQRDVCIFELIERNQAVMKVYVFRES